MASLAVSPGLRKVFAATISPSVAFVVTCAQPDRIDQPSRMGPCHGPEIELRWSQVQRLAAPPASARTAASRIAGQKSVWGHSRTPSLTSPMVQPSRWSWTPVIRTRNVTRGWMRNVAIDSSVGPSGW